MNFDNSFDVALLDGSNRLGDVFSTINVSLALAEPNVGDKVIVLSGKLADKRVFTFKVRYLFILTAICFTDDIIYL